MASKREEKAKEFSGKTIQMDFTTRIRLLFLKPSEFFEKVKKEEIILSFSLFVAVLIIGSFLSLIVSNSILVLVSSITSVIFLFIYYITTHIFAYLLGGRNGIKQSLKALMYASIPIMIVNIPFSLAGKILSANPYFGLIVLVILGIWLIYLEGLGLGKIHGFGTGKGILAGLLSLFTLLILFALFLFSTLQGAGVVLPAVK